MQLPFSAAVPLSCLDLYVMTLAAKYRVLFSGLSVFAGIKTAEQRIRIVQPGGYQSCYNLSYGTSA